MYCKNCGHNVPDKNRFCVYCGAPLRAAEQPEKHIQLPKQGNYGTGKTADTVSPISTNSKTTSSPKGLIAIFIAILVVLLIIILVFAFGNGGMKAAAEEYVEEYYNAESATVESYKEAEEDELEWISLITDSDDIKKAVLEVEVSYLDEYLQSGYAYIDCIYKDSTGWHVLN